MSAAPKPLVVVPTYLSEPEDVEVTRAALESVRSTQGGSVEVLVVDDGSPEPSLVDDLEKLSAQLQFEVHRKEENTGFSRTVNVGLAKALTEGRDAILMNADIELQTKGWLAHMRRTTGSVGTEAAVVGALLLYPNGLIQHAGVYFSLLTRSFDHRFKYGPGNLPEALEKEVCPVTGALQFIRHETLREVGLYDETFLLGWEDVDYCIRVFKSGRECVYNPNIRAFHYESLFRGRPSARVAEWQSKSLYYLIAKYQHESFADFVPTI